MNHFSSLLKAILTVTCLLSMHAQADSAPAEKNSAQIQRNATSANPITLGLSKNLFRNEDYQAPYTVQVPYQATESYTVEIPYQAEETYEVQVPYQVDESYTVQVPYEDTETYTENVPYTENVAYTDYETDYRNEYRCQNVTRYRQECHNDRQCYLIPGTGGDSCRDVEECGTNAQGQPICKTRRVCDGSTAPQQRCEDKQICQNSPYTEQECANVQVPYQRQVTRYRQETHYRQETRTRSVTRYRNETRTRTVTKNRTETRSHTVTKTRTETRTREVTKYRDEVKCCVTKTRQIFDRQLQYNVNVVFPQDAVLAENETETLTIGLVSADANTAVVKVDVGNSIYGYKVANQTTAGASIQVELAISAKYDLANAGVSSIQNLRIDFLSSAQKFQVSFVDSLKSSHVHSSYALVISDLASGALIEELPVSALANGQLGAVLTTVLDSKSKIKALLKVKRSGVLVAGSEIGFETSVNFEKRTLQNEDVASLSVAKNISGQLVGEGLESALLISDLTAEFADVTTEYTIYLDLKSGGTSKPLNKASFTREQIKTSGQAIKLADVIKSSSAIKSALSKGQTLSFDLIAVRKGASSVLGSKTVKAATSGTFVIK